MMSFQADAFVRWDAICWLHGWFLSINKSVTLKVALYTECHCWVLRRQSVHRGFDGHQCCLSTAISTAQRRLVIWTKADLRGRPGPPRQKQGGRGPPQTSPTQRGGRVVDHRGFCSHELPVTLDTSRHSVLLIMTTKQDGA